MRFSISLMLVLLSIALQFQILGAWLWTPDFLLTALIVTAFFASLPELVALLTVSYWLVNWQPGLGLDAFLLIALPLLVWLARTYFPWQAWTSVLGTCAAAILAFYTALLPLKAIAGPILFFDLILSLAYGGFIFILYFGIIGYPWADKRRLFA